MKLEGVRYDPSIKLNVFRMSKQNDKEIKIFGDKTGIFKKNSFGDGCSSIKFDVADKNGSGWLIGQRFKSVCHKDDQVVWKRQAN